MCLAFLTENENVEWHPAPLKSVAKILLISLRPRISPMVAASLTVWVIFKFSFPQPVSVVLLIPAGSYNISKIHPFSVCLWSSCLNYWNHLSMYSPSSTSKTTRLAKLSSSPTAQTAMPLFESLHFLPWTCLQGPAWLQTHIFTPCTPLKPSAWLLRLYPFPSVLAFCSAAPWGFE